MKARSDGLGLDTDWEIDEGIAAIDETAPAHRIQESSIARCY